MKELIFNKDNLKDTEINMILTKVKVIILNRDNKLLLKYCDGIYQFPGGYVEENETLATALKREIKEEIGIEVDTNNMLPFYCIKHYKKNCDEIGINKMSQSYCFLVKTDKKINSENIKDIEHEKIEGYRLEYVSVEDVKKSMKTSISNNVISSTIVKEMLVILEACGIICETPVKDKCINHMGTKEVSTSRLLLRKFREEDAEELYNGYMNQEEFLYYANKERKSIEEIRDLMKKKLERYSNDAYYNWVITLKETGNIIGAINLIVNSYNDSVEFNYAIDNRYINNGYMTEALNEVKKFCLNDLNVNRFQGCCCVENLASKRVMEKCKMDYEGILRRYIKLKDGYHDMYMFSIING